MGSLKLFLLSMLSCSIFATTLTLQVKKPNHHIFLRDSKKFLEYRPNSSLHWGVKLTGNFFYIQYGQKIKGTNYSGQSVGNDSYGDYKIGFAIANTYTEFFYKEYIGFSSDEVDKAGCDFCYDRPNLSSRERNFSFFWAIEPSFKMSNLSSSGNGGAEKGRSWLINIFYSRLSVRDPETLVQGDKEDEFSFFDDILKLDMRQVGLGVGYAFIEPFGPFYFSLGGMIGAGYQKNEIIRTTKVTDDTNSAVHWAIKTNLGTHGLWANYGIKGLFFSNVYKLAGSQSLASVNYSIYAYLTHKF